jgi:hypothetical protein
MTSQTHLSIVSLRFSLADEPRTHIKYWHEDLSAKACGLCPQWDTTGAITLIADDAYWNAMPGHITRPAATGIPAAYKARPDFTPPAALDSAATAVELVNWRLEMDMHFAYTMANKALATAVLDSVGESNKAALKVAFHPHPLHFLTSLEMVTEMFRKHAALTGPDLQKLRAPLHEPLLAIADLEKHMTAFQLASTKLSKIGHGEDAYRYFEWFKETVKGFPLIATTMVGYYAMQPLVAQQNIATLFAYLAPQCTHLIEQTGTAPFSGGALTPAPKGTTPNLNRRKKQQKGKNQAKATWGSWRNSASPGHFAGPPEHQG